MQKKYWIPELQFTLWTHVCSTHNTHAQVGVYHALTHTSPVSPQHEASSMELTHTTTTHPVRTNTAALSVHYTTSSTALTRRKKDNAIYRSFFQIEKTTPSDRLHGYSRISLTSTIERVALDIYFDHNIYDIVIN